MIIEAAGAYIPVVRCRNEQNFMLMSTRFTFPLVRTILLDNRLF